MWKTPSRLLFHVPVYLNIMNMAHKKIIISDIYIYMCVCVLLKQVCQLSSLIRNHLINFTILYINIHLHIHLREC